MASPSSRTASSTASRAGPPMTTLAAPARSGSRTTAARCATATSGSSRCPGGRRGNNGGPDPTRCAGFPAQRVTISVSSALSRKVLMFAERFRVTSDRFRLSDHDPGDTEGVSHEESKTRLAEDIEEMIRLQDRFYAAGRHALLLIFQAPDAAGKDSVIKHVMSGLNPTGCQVHSFKSPSSGELQHDYLWRAACKLPERGRIGIFN